MGFFAGKSGNQKIIAIGPSQNPHTDPNGSYFHSQWPYMTTQVFETTNFSQNRDHVYFGVRSTTAIGWPTQYKDRWYNRCTCFVTLGINDGNIQQWIASGRVFIVQALIWGVWYTVPPRVEQAWTDVRGAVSQSETITDALPTWSNPGQTIYGRGTGTLRLCVGGVLSGAPISSLRFIFIENLYSTGGGGLSYSSSNPNNDRELYIDRTNLRVGSENYLYKRFFCYTDQLGGGYGVGCPSVYAAGNYRSDVYEDYFDDGNFSNPVRGSTIGVSANSMPVGGGYWPSASGSMRSVEELTTTNGNKDTPYVSTLDAANRGRYRDNWGCRVFKAMALSDYGQSLSIDNTRILSGGTEVFGPNVYLYKAVLANVGMYFEGGRRRIQDYPMGNSYEEVTRADVRGAMRNGFLTGLITIPSDGLQKPPAAYYLGDGICGFQNNMAMPFRLADGEEMLLFNCSSKNFKYLGTHHYQHSVSVVMRNSGGILVLYKVTTRVTGGGDPYSGDEMVIWPRCRALVSLLG